jgi:MscS family membrane protein
MVTEYLQNEYVRATLILLGVYIGIKLLILITSKILPNITGKTKTTWDDELLGRTTGPITWVAMLTGLRFAIGQIALQETYKKTVEGILGTLLSLAIVTLIYHLIDSVITAGMTKAAKKARIQVNESLIQFSKSILKFVAGIAAFLLILNNWGIQIGPLLAGLGVAGIAIAFALQNTLGNIFGGISMLLDRSVNKDDWVTLEDGTTGVVKSVGIRSTRVRTFDNEIIIVPNGKLSDSNIKNIALPEPKARVVIPFGVAYGSNIEKVKKIVMKEINGIKNKIDEPEPMVMFLEMADSALNFKAYFYVKSFEDRFKATDEANTKIYNALNKNNISIPFPQMDIHIKEHKKK